ncbi:transcriptional regulator, IclR family [Noviherbaspirillum humi]|uniref:Transcriptional regulator, IclR family n=1 Tax=Noviherbaspirillum humi TaxID=1688639 RepID=A0A239IKR8_9BURK|nr:IclR family transcriptional regulator [Noviherbaspirillum humi]SNS94366.1 transcriptional regulator, IclR family [Noviherbaspirillum humi]
MAKTASAAKPKVRLSSVANAMRLLKSFSDDNYEIGISELAKQLRLAKSTAHRLASTLVEAGMLEQNAETGKYKLGLVVFELGSLVRRKMDFSNEAKPVLMHLREKTGETVHLAILESASIIYTNTLESKQSIRMTSDVGLRRSAFASAEGMVLLAFQSKQEIELLLKSRDPSVPKEVAANTAALAKEFATIRNRGYSIDDEESEPGLCSIAAPIRDYTGNVVAAVSIAGPAQRLNKKTLQAFAQDVVEAAEAISSRLGFRHIRPIRLEQKAAAVAEFF